MSGDKIRTLRRKHGLTQEQLGAMVGFSQSKISKIENGDWDSLRDLRLIAKALEVPIEELVRDEHSDEKQVLYPFSNAMDDIRFKGKMAEMNGTYLELFALLKNALLPGECEPPQDLEDWAAVFREMQAQAVAALPYAWLKERQGQQTVNYSPWITQCLQSQAKWVKVMHGQARLLALLADHQIDCVILKGAAAAMAYPNPSLRAMGDVDFLVKRCDRNRTARLLEENGYTLEHEKDESLHHYGYTKDGVSFELHWRIAIVRDSDEKLISRLEEGITNREIRETGGFSFPVLPVELNGLVLISHINQHLRSGLGLRQIIDWMMYVNALPNEPVDVWSEKLRPMLRDVGMEKLALCVTVMCQRCLGLQKNLAGCETVDSKLCDELLEYVMEKGNFGRKSGETGKLASFSLDMSNPVRFFKRLHAGGMSNWNAARKHAVLRPFAWIYQIGYINKRLIKNGISPGKVAEQHTQGVKQRELIRALGLEVDRNIDVRRDKPSAKN